jgi:hypothetical protein
MFPIPDTGSSYANLNRDIFLVQSKFKATAAQVVAEGDWFFSEFFR